MMLSLMNQNMNHSCLFQSVESVCSVSMCYCVACFGIGSVGGGAKSMRGMHFVRQCCVMSLYLE